MLGQQQNRHGQSKSVRINSDYFRWKKQTIQNQSLVENVCQEKKAWHGSVDGNDYISPHCATRMGSLGLLLGPVGTFWGASRIYRKSYCRFNTSTSLLVDQHNLNTLFEFNLAWYHQHPLYDLEKGKKILLLIYISLPRPSRCFICMTDHHERLYWRKLFFININLLFQMFNPHEIKHEKCIASIYLDLPHDQ